MYLIDTNVVSEMRKRERANPGVAAFFDRAAASNAVVYLSVITIGELRRGVENIRHRGDQDQARILETWLTRVTEDYFDQILPFDADAALVWGRLRVPDPEHAIDKQIAATALVHDLILVTRNVADFRGFGLKLLDPFAKER